MPLLNSIEVCFNAQYETGVAILERRTTIYKISSLGSFDLFATVT